MGEIASRRGELWTDTEPLDLKLIGEWHALDTSGRNDECNDARTSGDISNTLATRTQ
jgi:hypothetical protein